MATTPNPETLLAPGFEETGPTVPSFQASDFSVELPDDAIDASSYCFVFPNAGEFPPNLTIRVEGPPPELDLDAYVKEQRQALESSVEDFELLNEISSKRDFWTYVVSIVEWGPDDSRIRQKHTLSHRPQEWDLPCPFPKRCIFPYE